MDNGDLHNIITEEDLNPLFIATMEKSGIQIDVATKKWHQILIKSLLSKKKGEFH